MLYNLLESIRILGILLTPFIPATAENMLTQLGVDGSLTAMDTATGEYGAAEQYKVGEATPLFARIDAAKVLAELEAERQAAAAKEEKAEKTAENVAFLSEITIDDFAKIDLRVAEIIDCEPVKKAKKLLKLTLDDGSGMPRIVCSGIAKWYAPDDLKGRRIVVVANLKPAVLCGVESQGMILAADDGEAARVLFVDGVAPGSKVR